MNLILYPGLCFMLRYCGNVPLCFCVPAFPFRQPHHFPSARFLHGRMLGGTENTCFWVCDFSFPKTLSEVLLCRAASAPLQCVFEVHRLYVVQENKEMYIWTICLCVALLLYTNLLKYCSAVLCAQPVIVFGATHRSFSGIAVNIQMKWCYCRLCIHMFLPSSLVWMA